LLIVFETFSVDSGTNRGLKREKKGEGGVQKVRS